jgi:hypothetical protein
MRDGHVRGLLGVGAYYTYIHGCNLEHAQFPTSDVWSKQCARPIYFEALISHRCCRLCCRHECIESRRLDFFFQDID